jgi:hypothetical protein
VIVSPRARRGWPAGAVALSLLAAAQRAGAQQIMAAGRPARLDIRAAGAHTLRVTLRPLDAPDSA